ncbi:hypothetical protein ACKI2N_015315 [Cupriavidus sp. 30B13]|uniref:hypothetical protein n=1 Tax=Cupriavidus sp. 30B13 TaxID=3384241 RepID=UPI003B914BAD
MTSKLFPAPRRAGVRLRMLAAAGAACAACLLVSGCGGDDGAPPAPAQATVPGSTAALGAGGVTGEVPIVAAPAPGPCAASGTPALPSPLLNSRLDCAP